MTSPYDTYSSPLASRNASPEMLRLWSPRHKFNTWRRVWLAVAEAMHEVSQRAPGVSEGGSPGGSHGAGRTVADAPGSFGAPGSFHAPGSSMRELVTREQVEELRAVVERGITDDEIRLAERYERDLRHDVMAHVHALGDACPKARPIIHLGMTSQDVVCNADMLIVHEAMRLASLKLGAVIVALGSFAEQWKGLPTLGFTHFQPAQPVTLGRRAAQWAYDLNCTVLSDRADLSRFGVALKGFRGATGTQASYLSLFNGDPARVEAMERSTVEKLCPPGGEACCMMLSGQTYPRVLDAQWIGDAASVAAVLHKIATDIRLLSNRKELDEPFEDKQVGSSAMPYKRNPMRCERICGLSRFVMNLVGNAYDTAATQWLERTLDDSSNRRLSLPEAFLALDGALDLMHNVASGLVVHEAMVRRNLMAELPFLATENILMECVRLGGDRQEYHEKVRVHAQAAGMRVKHEGLDNDLLDRLQADRAFWGKARGGPLSAELNWDGLMDPMRYIGRSVEQTERFIKEVVDPLREQYAGAIAKLGESGPRV
jgi:adenylosuccinate lyase